MSGPDSRDRTILRLAVPALATLAIEPLYVLVDTAIVGHLGTAPLGGLALASTVLTTAFFVVTFLEHGVPARVAVLVGRVRSGGAGPRPDRSGLGRLLRMGWHLSGRTGSLLGTLALSTAVAARLGPATLGGHQIALQMENLLALLVDGLAIAAQALVATALGAGDAQEARAVGRRLVTWGVGAGIGLCVVVVAVSHVVPHVVT